MSGRTLGARIGLGLGLALLPALAPAAPHLPPSDASVVETLPIRYDPALAALQPLRAALQRQPGELAPSLNLARAYIAAARRNADPRFLGYAQATLSAWPQGAGAPLDVRVLRATILQSLHQFDAALAELDAVLAVRPGHAQALLTRATILQVRGRFVEAQRDCGALLRTAGEVSAALCLASVAGVTGREASAQALARHALADAPVSEGALQVWAHTMLAEISARAGELAAADGEFQVALRLDPTDHYARSAYCDFLLDHGRAQRVLDLTAPFTRDDNLLLRRALAWQALASAPDATDAVQEHARARSELAAAVGQLRERHAAALWRGDRTHLREAARFNLFLLHDADTALRLARENWLNQKEPADARILLEAAAAAHDATQRGQLLAWVRNTGLRDVQLVAR